MNARPWLCWWLALASLCFPALDARAEGGLALDASTAGASAPDGPAIGTGVSDPGGLTLGASTESGQAIEVLAGNRMSAAASEIFGKEMYRHASVSVMVTDISGAEPRPVFSLNPDMALSTASTAKLVTTATALEVLGPDFRFDTRLYADGTMEQGTLHGNLWIVPDGDPSLGSEYISAAPKTFLSDWTEALQRAGIHRVEGCLLLLSGRYAEPVPSTWLWEDMGNYYASGVFDAAVYDNMYRLYLRSGKNRSDAGNSVDRPKSGEIPDDRTRPEVSEAPDDGVGLAIFKAGDGLAEPEVEVVSVQPPLPRISFDNRLKVYDKQQDSVYIYGAPRQWRRTLYGCMPAGQEHFCVKGDIPDPEQYLLDVVAAALADSGFGRLETAVSDVGPRSRWTLVARTLSPPLSELIRVTNVYSNNQYAEYLFRRTAWALAREANCEKPGLTESRSIDWVRRFWASRGLDVGAWFLADGCGLSPRTAMSASALVELLCREAGSERGGELRRSLPLAGKEGTVAGFGRSLSGECRLKSGSMSAVRTYAGYYAKDGHSYVFALMVNRFDGPSRRVQSDLEALLRCL